jgi:hypothetical protein
MLRVSQKYCLNYRGIGLKHCRFRASKGIILATLPFLHLSNDQNQFPSARKHVSPLQNT